MSSRRYFLQTATALGAALVLPRLRAQEPAPATAATRIPDRGPPLTAELVKAFVVAGHGDLAKMRAMLAEQPRLLNASWDWGGGDFETALGGAAHMGRREIARFLLEQGARVDVFGLAMLGDLAAVQAIVAARPETVRCAGPHGIPLIVHAQKGGAEAAAVADFLKALSPAG
ncbi:MAG TPA: twin-arginine translocation signal domain-containing protein [Lacunisphaera sp.]|nr:twin-arginine translocation signal domain-containing protein [Lacunisphaera sp.]